MDKQKNSGQWLTDNQVSRRNFLSLCAAGTLPILLGACQTAPTANANPTPTGTATSAATKAAQPTPTKAPVLSEQDWSELGKKLAGPLLRPNSAQYETAHQLFNTRFDTIKPAAIAYCSSPKDVQTCLEFVRKFNLPVTPRAGGHSYAGYSTTTGLLLDVTRMNSISIDAVSGNATIGSGARLIDIYQALTQHNRILPGGSCPTVGISGLTMGGGVGVIGRKFGLTCDNLLSAQVVLADGRLVTCDAQNNADLYWGLRGGGGGNFGIVTSFTFRTYPLNTLSIFTLSWSWSNAAAVLDAWQNWAPSAPDELWSNCLLLTSSDGQGDPLVRINGVYVGDLGPLNTLLQQVIDKVGVAPTGRYSNTTSVLDTMLYEAGCYNKSIEACRLPGMGPQGSLQRDTSKAKSDYITRRLSQQGIKTLVNAIEQRQISPTSGTAGIGIDAFGGKINQVAPDATAFVHRNTLFSIQYTATWSPNDTQRTIAGNIGWLDQTWQGMRPYASGSAYQNYIDPDLSNWQQAYYGNNLARLQQVKATYDPNNLFHFKQSIPLKS
ncbi:FAD-binding oxidoreductase [Dictyobacter arantiisoli]|uniref:FAD-binding dehydrogenase n=1 Tax=Dictyobacter arantiisoli TaxID=2014874 RepID=A0A5A5TB63_9CHLR|nr:FAD-binding oxidoreductase [Dictyobacter arantiisoli]GCF08396.1 FAD-binding dehydrogenase [Dictyobacter arantiisoli]